ncbi:hypothetical protein STEG23_008247, partial [Scotinomys teguina]
VTNEEPSGVSADSENQSQVSDDSATAETENVPQSGSPTEQEQLLKARAKSQRTLLLLWLKMIQSEFPPGEEQVSSDANGNKANDPQREASRRGLRPIIPLS